MTFYIKCTPYCYALNYKNRYFVLALYSVFHDFQIKVAFLNNGVIYHVI